MKEVLSLPSFSGCECESGSNLLVAGEEEMSESPDLVLLLLAL
jgi:hypothetical protein